LSPLDRRGFLLAGACGLAACATAKSGAAESAAFIALEAEVGGRLGVMALDTGTGHTISYRAQERFAMCSAFKWLLAAAVLAKVETGALSLDEMIAYKQTDLLDYAPVVRAHLAEGRLPVRALCAAAVEVSDNAAANLLLPRIGGPGGLTTFLRGVGDNTTRLDRNEPSLNTNLPNDPRDTTTPAAMASTMNVLLCGNTLAPAGRAQLIEWLKNCSTGGERLRAGLPVSWQVGDKTGTGANGAVVDVAIAWPPARKPIVIASFCSGSTAPVASLATAHAKVAAHVAAAFS
jgi:beta-lactamase class A